MADRFNESTNNPDEFLTGEKLLMDFFTNLSSKNEIDIDVSNILLVLFQQRQVTKDLILKKLLENRKEKMV